MQDRWWDDPGSRDPIDPGTEGDRVAADVAVGVATGVRLERVVPTISMPMLWHESGEAVTMPASEDDGRAFDVPWASVRQLPVSAMAAAVIATLAVATLAAGGDIRVGVLWACIVGLVGYLRAVDRQVPFSFGEGFVGYRADPGWPRGVQEEDGVRWRWSVSPPQRRP